MNENHSIFRTASNRIRSFLRKLEVDRAVFFGLLSKAWGMVITPITALLIAKKFSPEVQGYYYTFSSLLAMQILVELGFGMVIIQFASHEWSKLKLDMGHITGDREALSRLVSLANISLKWYLIGGLIVAFGLGSGGYIYFSLSHISNTNWVSPWLTLCLLTGATICLVPVWSLLEGCNQVKQLYTYRFWQSIFANLSVFLAILLGAELWASSIFSMVALLCAGIFLWRNYRLFLKTLFFSQPTGARMEWRSDIFPMQWRIALSYISGYFIFFFFTPVIFYYQGPVVAGQFGMTWSLLGVMGSISSAWLAPKVPQFGILIAGREYKKLDEQFWHLTKIIAYITVALAISIELLVYLLYLFDYPIAKRLLPPLPTGIFLLAQAIVAIIHYPTGCYLRAHKREPLLLVSLMGGFLIGLSTLVLGKYYSVTGIAIGNLGTMIILTPFIVLIWHQCRIDWHKE